MVRFLISLILSTVTLTAAASAQTGEMWLTIDQVRAYDLRQPVSSIVVGNPAIADVTVQSNNKVLLYGKAPGFTNIYFFDGEGNRLDNINIRVQSQTDNMMVVYRGTARASYTCTRNCEPMMVIGDSPEIFDPLSQQAQRKSSDASSAAAQAAENR